MENFKIGDVVYLKSGSKAMTITDISGDKCYVVWHKDGEERISCYTSQALTKDNPGHIPPEAFKKS